MCSKMEKYQFVISYRNEVSQCRIATPYRNAVSQRCIATPYRKSVLQQRIRTTNKNNDIYRRSTFWTAVEEELWSSLYVYFHYRPVNALRQSENDDGLMSSGKHTSTSL